MQRLPGFQTIDRLTISLTFLGISCLADRIGCGQTITGRSSPCILQIVQSTLSQVSGESAGAVVNTPYRMFGEQREQHGRFGVTGTIGPNPVDVVDTGVDDGRLR